MLALLPGFRQNSSSTPHRGEIVQLIPRDVKFYDLFREQAGNIHQAAQMLVNLFEDF